MTKNQTHGILLALFAATAFGFTATSTPLRSANDRSRWSTVWSLVERGTYQIDEIQQRYAWQTIDKARHRSSEDADWHEYSTKPPLTPTLVAGVYYVVKKATGLSLFKRTHEATRIVLIIVNVLPMLIALWLFSRLLLRHCENEAAGIFVLATACFATLLTPFLTTFNNHSIAATGVLFTIYFVAKIVIEGSRSAWHFALAGFFAMWTCCNELPAALFGLTVFALLYRVDRRRTLIAFAPAALVPLAGFFVTNYAATGGWKPLYMYYGTDRYVYTVDGVPSYWTNPKGLDANAESPATYLFHCVLGHHGILSLTPVFLLSVVSLLTPKSWKHSLRPFLLPTALLTIAILAFYLSRTQNYNYGGSTSGLRWAFWLIPLWLVAMVPLVDRCWSSRKLRVFASLLLVASVASAATAYENPWGHPWLLNEMKKRNWVNYSIPPPTLDREVRSWLYSYPKLSDGESVTVTFENDRVPTQRLTMTATQSGKEAKLLIDAPSHGFSNAKVSIDVTALLSGSAPADFIQPSESPVRTALVRFLTGTPAPTDFLARGVRYEKTAVRKDAFESIHLSGTVYESSKKRRHRCDVWISDEVPFATVMFQTTVADTVTNRILARETWKIASIERSANADEND